MTELAPAAASNIKAPSGEKHRVVVGLVPGPRLGGLGNVANGPDSYCRASNSLTDAEVVVGGAPVKAVALSETAKTTPWEYPN